MVSLTDIGKLTSRTAEIGGVSFLLYPISVSALVNLMDRFPVLKNVLVERKIGISIDDFLKMGVEVCGAIVAVGIGKAGDAAEEKAAAELGIGELGDLLMKIIDVTFPKGFGPFMEFIERMQGGGSGGTGKGPATNSPTHSNSASIMATDKPLGGTPQENSADGPKSSNGKTSAAERI